MTRTERARGTFVGGRWRRWARGGIAGCLLAIGCSGGDGGKTGDSTIRAQLVNGLASVQLTAGAVVRTFALQTLSPTPTTFDISIPRSTIGTIQVTAIARPADGCNGFAGTDLALIGSAGETATVILVMPAQAICQPTGAGGTGGAVGTGGAGGSVGGSAGGSGGVGGTTGGSAGGATAGTGGGGGTGGASGTVGTGGASGTGGVAGTGGRGGGGATGGASGTG